MKTALYRTALAVTLSAFALSALAALDATPPVRADPNPAPRVAAPAAAEPALQGTVNINQASAEQLRMLPGIGEAKAARIVQWRKKHGRFRRVRDLRRVKGFGRRSVQKLERYLSVTGPTTLRRGR